LREVLIALRFRAAPGDKYSGRRVMTTLSSVDQFRVRGIILSTFRRRVATVGPGAAASVPARETRGFRRHALLLVLGHSVCVTTVGRPLFVCSAPRRYRPVPLPDNHHSNPGQRHRCPYLLIARHRLSSSRPQGCLSTTVGHLVVCGDLDAHKSGAETVAQVRYDNVVMRSFPRLVRLAHYGPRSTDARRQHCGHPRVGGIVPPRHAALGGRCARERQPDRGVRGPCGRIARHAGDGGPGVRRRSRALPPRTGLLDRLRARSR
jgi:hypothetical protein